MRKICNISHEVAKVELIKEPKKGFPKIGDNCYIGPGAKIIGKIHVGDNVVIGANCVVTKDIPDNSVVVGVQGKIITRNGFQKDTLIISIAK